MEEHPTIYEMRARWAREFNAAWPGGGLLQAQKTEDELRADRRVKLGSEDMGADLVPSVWPTRRGGA